MSLQGKKILITCGPTWVALDDMRVISNRSTGEMGHLLAQTLKRSKANVTLVEGPVTHTARIQGIKVLKYCFFNELSRILDKEVRRGYDCVIHAAAVSDFKPQQKLTGKIKSDTKVTVHLTPLPKLINRIKALRPDVFLVGFKLESFLDDAKAIEETKKLFSQSRCDLVVANFLKTNGYEALLLDRELSLLGKAKNKKALVKILIEVLKRRL